MMVSSVGCVPYLHGLPDHHLRRCGHIALHHLQCHTKAYHDVTESLVIIVEEAGAARLSLRSLKQTRGPPPSSGGQERWPLGGGTHHRGLLVGRWWCLWLVGLLLHRERRHGGRPVVHVLLLLLVRVRPALHPRGPVHAAQASISSVPLSPSEGLLEQGAEDPEEEESGRVPCRGLASLEARLPYFSSLSTQLFVTSRSVEQESPHIRRTPGEPLDCLNSCPATRLFECLEDCISKVDLDHELLGW